MPFWRNWMLIERKATLKVALNTSVPLNELDNSQIALASDYSVLELLHSTLVQYDNQGELIGDIAERFFWENNDLVFEFKDTYTSKGRRITPKDADASFKRLMILNKNSHGNLVNLLCMDKIPKSINDDCNGLKIDGNRLILKTKDKSPFLLPLLTNLDYGIIPKDSLDELTLKIKDPENTTGPYQLIRTATGTYRLQSNKNHWRYSHYMPHQVEFYPFDYESNSSNSAENQFLNGKVDFIPTAAELTLADAHKLKNNFHGSVSIHATNPMYLAYAEFTRRGQTLPIETRRHLLASFRKGVVKTLVNDDKGRIPTLQILPPSSEGNLSLIQLSEMESILAKYEHPLDATGIKIAVPSSVLPFYQKAFESEVKNLTFISNPKIVSFGDRMDEDVPHLSISAVDVTSIEDINFISYSVKHGILVPPQNQTPAAWLKQYFDTQEKSNRMAMLQKIQFNTIWENPSIIPLSIRPFVSIIDSKWSTDFSKLFPNDPFWKIQLK
jgi:hypothetical protein